MTLETPAERVLCGMTLEEMAAACEAAGQPAFRAKQIAQWIYSRRVFDLGRMTNLPKEWRERMRLKWPALRCETIQERRSADGTVKLLVGLRDSERIETVLIPEGRRRTVCVSTQVGCAMGCRFCASGESGLVRNLDADEIVGQALLAQALLPRRERISNVVFMGMGEPLANYDAVLKSVRILNADWGLHIAARRITISTVGLPDRIRRLAEENLQLVLAISLHAADEEKRRELLPAAGRIPLEEVLAAARDYFERTGREVTFEYALFEGVNSGLEDARRLADLLGDLRCHINLIPFNSVPGGAFRAPDPDAVDAFRAALEARGLKATVRSRRGADIEAACGQLRRRARAG